MFVVPEDRCYYKRVIRFCQGGFLKNFLNVRFFDETAEKNLSTNGLICGILLKIHDPYTLFHSISIKSIQVSVPGRPGEAWMCRAKAGGACMARESYAGKINRKLVKKLHVVEVAAGRCEADLVLKNATYVNVFCNELSHGDIAVAGGLIAGMGGPYHGAREVDVGGKLVLPGFVDAHIHLESALVTPTEFVRAVLPHGTTTVIADPHEIANVMGTDGIEYILQATAGLPVDVRVMLPSCVPATPMDESGASLDYRALDSHCPRGAL